MFRKISLVSFIILAIFLVSSVILNILLFQKLDNFQSTNTSLFSQNKGLYTALEKLFRAPPPEASSENKIPESPPPSVPYVPPLQSNQHLFASVNTNNTDNVIENTNENESNLPPENTEIVSEPENNEETGTETFFENDKFGVSIRFPPGWEGLYPVGESWNNDQSIMVFNFWLPEMNTYKNKEELVPIFQLRKYSRDAYQTYLGSDKTHDYPLSIIGENDQYVFLISQREFGTDFMISKAAEAYENIKNWIRFE